jgi:zinc transporter 5/7
VHSHDHDDHDHDDHDHDHGHHHGHSHNMQGVFLHVLADTLGSVGVIVSTLLIRWTGWTGWDPLASLFIAALILASVLPLVTDAARVLALDAKDFESSVRAALAKVKALEGVESYSSPRFWPKGEGLVVGSIHVQVATNTGNTGGRPATWYAGHVPAPAKVDTARLAAKVEKTLKRSIPGLTEVVVQLETEGWCSCMTSSGLGLVPAGAGQ